MASPTQLHILYLHFGRIATAICIASHPARLIHEGSLLASWMPEASFWAISSSSRCRRPALPIWCCAQSRRTIRYMIMTVWYVIYIVPCSPEGTILSDLFCLHVHEDLNCHTNYRWAFDFFDPSAVGQSGSRVSQDLPCGLPAEPSHAIDRRPCSVVVTKCGHGQLCAELMPPKQRILENMQFGKSWTATRADFWRVKKSAPCVENLMLLSMRLYLLGSWIQMVREEWIFLAFATISRQCRWSAMQHDWKAGTEPSDWAWLEMWLGTCNRLVKRMQATAPTCLQLCSPSTPLIRIQLMPQRPRFWAVWRTFLWPMLSLIFLAMEAMCRWSQKWACYVTSCMPRIPLLLSDWYLDGWQPSMIALSDS